VNSLKAYREKVGLLQAEAAEALGVTQGAVSSWECGGYMPRADLLPKIATLYKCTIDDLLNVEKHEPA